MSGTLTLSPAAVPFPWAAAAIATFTSKASLNFDATTTTVSLELEGSTITAEDDIVQTLTKAGGLSDDSAKVCVSHPLQYAVLIQAIQTSAYFELAKTLPTVTAFPEITAALDSLDDHLTYRTFLVGHDIMAADWAVWGALKGLSVSPMVHPLCLLTQIQAAERSLDCLRITSIPIFFTGFHIMNLLNPHSLLLQAWLV